MLDYKTLAAESQLIALEQEIARLTAAMKAKESTWIFLADVEGGPDKKIRRLRPEYLQPYTTALSELTNLQERRAEIRRELNLDLEELYGG
jgi:hypothetical protein